MQGPLCDQWWWLSSVPVVVHGVCTWMDRHTREMKRRWCWMVEWKVKQTRTIVERQRSATEEEFTFFVMRDFWRAKLEIFWLAGRQATYSKSVLSAPRKRCGGSVFYYKRRPVRQHILWYCHSMEITAGKWAIDKLASEASSNILSISGFLDFTI